MRLYGAIQKVEPQDDGTVRVHGIATSEAVDEQGEIVRADAMRAAIPEYMRFPALREMHQLAAAGTTLEAEVGDDGVTRIVAHVVDPVAVAKVRNQVYRGFSIGGHVTQREATNPKAITGLILTEISLVDRPANPEAVFDCWKAAMMSISSSQSADQKFGPTLPDASTQVFVAVNEPFNAPVQIWSCGVSAHRHLAKAEALKCLKTISGFAREDGADRLPHGAGVGEDAKSEGETRAPGNRSAPAWFSTSISDADQMARVIPELARLRAQLEEIAATGDQETPAPRRMLDIIGEVCDLLSAFASEVGDSAVIGAPDREFNTAGDRGSQANTPRLDPELVKAKHSRADQAMLDMARLACEQCVRIAGLSTDERAAMSRALDNLLHAGAGGLETSAGTGDDEGSPRIPDRPERDGPVADLIEMTGSEIGQISKRGRPHQNLMDLAHQCLAALTDGSVCDRTATVDARHSQETSQFFKAAHDDFLAAGARCTPCAAVMPKPAMRSTPAAEVSMAAKRQISGDQSEPAAVAKVLGEIVPMIERLSRRVDEIARTPLPPLTMAKGTVAVSKQWDGNSDLAVGEFELSQEAIAAALAKMSKEEQTLTLIKASHAAPIRIPGSTVDPR